MRSPALHLLRPALIFDHRQKRLQRRLQPHGGRRQRGAGGAVLPQTQPLEPLSGFESPRSRCTQNIMSATQPHLCILVLCMHPGRHEAA